MPATRRVHITSVGLLAEPMRVGNRLSSQTFQISWKWSVFEDSRESVFSIKGETWEIFRVLSSSFRCPWGDETRESWEKSAKFVWHEKEGVQRRPRYREIIYVFGSIYLVRNLQGGWPKIPKKTGPGRPWREYPRLSDTSRLGPGGRSSRSD